MLVSAIFVFYNEKHRQAYPQSLTKHIKCVWVMYSIFVFLKKLHNLPLPCAFLWPFCDSDSTACLLDSWLACWLLRAWLWLRWICLPCGTLGLSSSTLLKLVKLLMLQCDCLQCGTLGLSLVGVLDLACTVTIILWSYAYSVVLQGLVCLACLSLTSCLCCNVFAYSAELQGLVWLACLIKRAWFL